MTIAAEPTPGDRSFAMTAAVVGMASLPLAAGNLLAMLASVHFDLGGVTNPLLLLRAGGGEGGVWRLSMVLDIIGYYLPIVPLILVLRTSLRWRGPSWVDLFTLSLLAYCLIGAIGGSELATALPTLMGRYGTDPQLRPALQAVFTGYTDGIYRGMWNLLEELLAGIGWLGFGVLLRRCRPGLGIVTIVLGLACLVDAMGTALHTDGISSVGLTIYLALAPTWACWLGITVFRRGTCGFRREPGQPGARHDVAAAVAAVDDGSRP